MDLSNTNDVLKNIDVHSIESIVGTLWFMAFWAYLHKVNSVGS